MAFGGRNRLVAVAAVCVVAAGLVGAAIALRPNDAGARIRQQSTVVEPREFVSTIALSGTIVPDGSVELTSPLAGVPTEVRFSYGAPVIQGQVLLVLDASEVEQQRDAAHAEYLKAAQAAADVAAWKTGPDVSRDRRSVETAAFDLRETRRKAEETKALLDRGLVARDEYESLVQEQHNHEVALAAARQELATTLRRGEGANRTIATIELNSARQRLALLDAQLAGAVVRSPVSGIIVRPPSDKADGGQIHVGLPLAKGQLIGSVASAGAMAVAFRLSETDANKVHAGQEVTVTGPGFAGLTLKGRIRSVAAEASPATATGGSAATFPAVAQLQDLTQEEARAVRIGMTADVVVETYRNASALVAPPEAIQGSAPATFIRVRDRGGRVHPAPVRIGQVAPDGVEVVSGLKAGDTIVWTAPAPSEN